MKKMHTAPIKFIPRISRFHSLRSAVYLLTMSTQIGFASTAYGQTENAGVLSLPLPGQIDTAKTVVQSNAQKKLTASKKIKKEKTMLEYMSSDDTVDGYNDSVDPLIH